MKLVKQISCLLMLLFYVVACVQEVQPKPKPKQEKPAPAQEEAARRFIENKDGTVTDTKTGLMWAAKDNGSDINWTNAYAYCKSYTGGGHDDWRLPAIEELKGLYDTRYKRSLSCSSMTYDVHLTHLISLSCYWMWSSGDHASSARTFDFNFGKVLRHDLSNSNYYRVLPVRSRKR